MTNKHKPRTPYATIVALLVVAGYYLTNSDSNPFATGSATEAPQSHIGTNDAGNGGRGLNLVAGAMVQSSGIVDRILADDNEGSRHQRFILRLASGETLLVAHNIDLAPRIDNLKTGDEVRFRGQYETNNRGGVIHWTHHDPRGNHAEGWLEHQGRRYE